MKDLFFSLVALASSALAVSLTDLCTPAHLVASLPVNNITTLTFNTGSVTATPVYNASANGQMSFPSANGLNYCNVTFGYSHNGLNDSVNVQYVFPDPSTYKNRFLATGGGGESINSGSAALLEGPVYGAVAGLTDGGFGGLEAQLTDVLLLANGTLNYRNLFNFAYASIHEMTIIGKQLSMNFYNSTNLYAYYSGCSEGGREGWSQVQRYGGQFDGALIGAPAFRQAYQQVNHLTSSVIEQTMGYAPPPCELKQIMTAIIEACDPLDGKTDGVVSRTDLCKLQYNVSSSVGQSYFCPATNGSMGPAGPSAPTPVQNGSVTAQGAAIAQAINDGLFDGRGRQVYMSYQPSASYDDATTLYNFTSNQWYATASGLGAAWIQMFLREIDTEDLALHGITYDTLRGWILEGLQKYSDTLQTVWPDLEDFQSNNGKVIHYHGESDFSVPADSSVIYQESVRKTMYPNMTFNDSFNALNDWYRLFLIPGAGHCSPSTSQPGPWPNDMLTPLIDWVENGVNPQTLNGTITGGSDVGQSQAICSWPLRPSWAGNSSQVQCIYPDEESLQTWYPNLNSIPIAVY